MSRLLINESPLQVLPTLATKIGLNEAIVLQQIHYWNDINEKANNNFKDGHYWTFNSYEEWNKQFPFWSSRTIQRAIKKLEDLKLLVSSNYNKLKIDRTKWYRIDHIVLQELEISPFGQNGTINMTKWLDHLDNVGLPLPEITTEITPKNTKKTFKHNPLDCGDSDLKHLSSIGIEFTELYLDIMNSYGIYEHRLLNPSAYKFILDAIDILEAEDVSSVYWEEEVNKHFKNLPKGNDGNIIPFLRASKRHFGVDLKDSLDW